MSANRILLIFVICAASALAACRATDVDHVIPTKGSSATAYQRAVALADESKIQEAIAVASEALTGDPKNSDLMFFLSTAYTALAMDLFPEKIHQTNLMTACDFAVKAAASLPEGPIGPKHVFFYGQAGNLLTLAGRPGDAIIYFEKIHQWRSVAQRQHVLDASYLLYALALGDTGDAGALRTAVHRLKVLEVISTRKPSIAEAPLMFLATFENPTASKEQMDNARKSEKLRGSVVISYCTAATRIHLEPSLKKCLAHYQPNLKEKMSGWDELYSQLVDMPPDEGANLDNTIQLSRVELLFEATILGVQ